MAFRLGLLAVLFVAAQGAVLVYPPGVSPAACPRYPDCDPLIDPSSGHFVANPANFPNYIPLNQKYPAGVSPAACPNYPDCNPSIDPSSGLPYIPASTHHSAVVPADVHPSLCTNWPYCSGVEQRQQEFLKTGIPNVPAGISPAAYYSG